MPGSFFDTNILLYLASNVPKKADRAERLLADGGTVSVQVLNEIANVARRKMRMPWSDVRELLAVLRDLLTVAPVTIETNDAGIDLAERHGFSTYDAMIVASALDSGCDTLWSEDMQHGLAIEGRLRILDPFRARSEAVP